MNPLSVLRRVVRAVVRRRAAEHDMAEEMRLHLDLLVEQKIGAGMSPDEARYAALREFGGVEQIRERCRDARGWQGMDRIRQDLRGALRQIRRAPAFSALAVAILALGIGGTTALFTVVNSVLLRPIDYPDSHRLVVIHSERLPQFPRATLSYPDFLDFEKGATAFESMYVVNGTALTMTGEGDPLQVFTARVSGRCFETLRLQPSLGRLFGPAEVQNGEFNVVVLSHGFWMRQFGGSKDVVGKTVRLNGEAATVIGVLAETAAPRMYDIYVPARFPEQQATNRNLRFLSFAFGRLKPGATVEEARVQLSTIATRLERENPNSNKGWTVSATPMLDYHVAEIRPTVWVMFAAVGLLLVIACANAANLLLVRAAARHREISIRAAMGATRGRIGVQLLVESLVVALIAGLVGVFLAWGLTRGLVALTPEQLPRAEEIALDRVALAFSAGITLLTGIAFGLAPAWYCRGMDVVNSLKASNRQLTGGRASSLMRRGFVVAETALAVVLLAGAGLLVRSFVTLARTDLGFEPRNAVMMWFMVPHHRTPDAQRAFADALTVRLRALPDVTHVGVTRMMPFSGNYQLRAVEVFGRTVAQPELPMAIYYTCSPDYLGAMGIRLLRGRGFSDQDHAGAPRVALVSQALAQRLFPGEDPLGKRISLDAGTSDWREIVGVVGDVRHKDYETEVVPQVYEPFAQNPVPLYTFVVRTRAAAHGLQTQVRRELIAVDPTVATFRLESLSTLTGEKIGRQRFAMMLIGAFAVLAFVMAVSGLYGVTSYVVTQRAGEFGIRLALGAPPWRLVFSVVAGGAKLLLPGVVIGIGLALAGGKLLTTILYRTSARDPWTLGAITSVIVATGLLACWLPARRAARVDPAATLRCD